MQLFWRPDRWGPARSAGAGRGDRFRDAPARRNFTVIPRGAPAPPSCAGAEPLPAGQLRTERFPEARRRGSGLCRFGGQRGGSAQPEAPASASGGVLGKSTALPEQPPETRGSTFHGAGGSRREGADGMALPGMSRPRTAVEIWLQGNGLALSSTGYPPEVHASEPRADMEPGRRAGALALDSIPASSRPVAQHGSGAGVLRVNRGPQAPQAATLRGTLEVSGALWAFPEKFKLSR